MTSPQLCAALLVAMVTAADAMLWGTTAKVNCAVSVWSNWVKNPDGTRTKFRSITRHPENGGATCPPLKQTEKDVWASETPLQKAPGVANKLLVPKPDVHKPRDFLFVIDMSGSIGVADFLTVKKNVADLVGKICGTVGPDANDNRVAVITFSSQVTFNFDFDRYLSLAQVKAAIMAMAYKGGGTDLTNALEYAKDSVFSPHRGMREDSQSVKEIVILTDGVWNRGTDAIGAAQTLSQSRNPPISIYAFAIKIPSKTDQDRIDRLVSEPVESHLFTFPDMDAFNSTVAIILTYPQTCAPIEGLPV